MRKPIESLAFMVLVVAILAAGLFAGCIRKPDAPIAVASTGTVYVEAVAMTLTGTGAGTATTYSNPLVGELVSIYIDYTASITSTCDVTVSYTSPLGGNILYQADSATDTHYFPRASLVTNAAAAITDGNDRFPLQGKLTVSFGQTTPGAVGTMYILYEK